MNKNALSVELVQHARPKGHVSAVVYISLACFIVYFSQYLELLWKWRVSVMLQRPQSRVWPGLSAHTGIIIRISTHARGSVSHFDCSGSW